MKLLRPRLGRTLGLCLVLSATAAHAELSPKLASVMQQLAGSMVALSGSLTDRGAITPAQVEAAEALAKGAAGLRSHTTSKEPGFGLLARELERDAVRVRWAVKRAKLVEANTALDRLLVRCVQCHSRLPDHEDSKLLANLQNTDLLNKMPPYRQVHVLIAARRFDEGLDRLGHIIADSKTPPAKALDHVMLLVTTSVRVKRDVTRPLSVVNSLGARKDLSAVQRRDLQLWAASLKLLRKQLAGPADVTIGRRLIEDAEVLDRQNDDIGSLVHFAVGSGLLLRSLDDPRLKAPARSEAFFFLALADELLPSAPTSSDVYLEAAVREAPGSDWAEVALARIASRQQRAQGTSGARERDPDQEVLLLELEQLVERAQAASPGRRKK